MQITAFGRDKKFKAILVYSEIYQWMKEHFLESVAEDRVKADEVLWALIVPGTWNNRTHHMIRQAGINVSILLSPCMSLYKNAFFKSKPVVN